MTPSSEELLILKNSDIAGVFHGTRALVGPDYVTVDITNRCNLDCIACWTFSPLLEEKKASLDWQRQELPWEVLQHLIDDLGSLGTQEIRLTGGGEPFMHKRCMDVIEEIKKRGMRCSVTTNFTLSPPAQIDRLSELIDTLTISLWAGSPQSYERSHPNRSAKTFEMIKERLLYLRGLNSNTPRVVIANVIGTYNYLDVGNMIDFALDVRAAEVYFTMVDPIAEKTDCLLLSAEQREAVGHQVVQKMTELESMGSPLVLDGIDTLLRRLDNPDGDSGHYDSNRVDELPCYVGWMFVRISANGEVAPCCRGVLKPSGNILKERFADIWQGPAQQTFRNMGLTQSKKHSYFADIDCFTTCDNLWQNEEMHKRINALSAEERRVLERVARRLEMESVGHG
jgi:MoaA/NifB/PqqE/SkfB family radical SAM enzyme